MGGARRMAEAKDVCKEDETDSFSCGAWVAARTLLRHFMTTLASHDRFDEGRQQEGFRVENRFSVIIP